MKIRFIDLFCGIGGFRLGAEAALNASRIVHECVFSSDIDEDAQLAYEANFRHRPLGDITKIKAGEIPDHDLLLAGFPCQPFSIMGESKGFEDTRGTLFFDIARILEWKKPVAFVLENVRRLESHDKGRTLARILETLGDLGYKTEYRILNALHFGLPQKRERLLIVGFRDDRKMIWQTEKVEMRPLSDLLELNIPAELYASDRIRQRRKESCDSLLTPSIWHENKSGHISALPYSCALRAGASHNYLLVNGERRLSPREMLRLQGFPESYRVIGNYGQIRKQAGNSVPVPMVQSVVKGVAEALKQEP